ncbi:MAG: hypothetical protein JHC87_00285 [Thermoleophilaceae bacterium]|nr:hypothetical protein [Thermoleophilaceae bacterium]
MKSKDSRLRKLLLTTIGVAVIAAALSGCGGPATFSTPTYPFSFEYPSGWTTSRNAAFVYGAGSGERSVAVAYKAPNDQVVVTQYKLQKTLPKGIVANQKEVDRIVSKLTKQAGGTASDARVVKYGGLPGYQYIIEYQQGGVPLRNTLTFLFGGDDEFQINCQSSEKNREEIQKGCDQVLSTLKFTN